jgi:asparaginyl-tRNA synthetase
MRPLYVPNADGSLGYYGNRLYKPKRRVSNTIGHTAFESRTKELHNERVWEHISRINHTINIAANSYFDRLGSLYVLLPLTTRMISSPGALYGKERLNYTQDTVPVKLKWFDLEKEVFLSESSQIYLELYLGIRNIDSVYSIYNSFRKENSDATHLSEFHHIEYEGKVSQKENKRIVLKFVGSMMGQLLKENLEDLEFFLFDEDIDYLRDFAKRQTHVDITFEQALDILHRSTGDPKYKKFTSKHFGSWEEVKLTSELGQMTAVSEFPLYEIAFYHAPLTRSNRQVGENTDFIWPYYREFVGAGHRVRSLKELVDKAKIFGLPSEDYRSYMASRKFKDYSETSGFGLGWERFLQGLLKMPYIYSSSAFPRVHNSISP